MGLLTLRSQSAGCAKHLVERKVLIVHLLGFGIVLVFIEPVSLHDVPMTPMHKTHSSPECDNCNCRAGATSSSPKSTAKPSSLNTKAWINFYVPSALFQASLYLACLRVAAARGSYFIMNLGLGFGFGSN